jgi:hypothetical protein
MIIRGKTADEFVFQSREPLSEECLEPAHPIETRLPGLEYILARRPIKGKLLVLQGNRKDLESLFFKDRLHFPASPEIISHALKSVVVCRASIVIMFAVAALAAGSRFPPVRWNRRSSISWKHWRATRLEGGCVERSKP